MNEILDSLPWFIFNKSLWNGLFELEFNYPRNIFISDDLPEITLIYCHVLRLIWFFLLLILYQVIYQVISISISNLFFAVQGGIQLLRFYICLFSLDISNLVSCMPNSNDKLLFKIHKTENTFTKQNGVINNNKYNLMWL